MPTVSQPAYPCLSTCLSDASSDFSKWITWSIRDVHYVCVLLRTFFRCCCCCWRALSKANEEASLTTTKIVSALSMPYAQRTHFQEFRILFFVPRDTHTHTDQERKRWRSGSVKCCHAYNFIFINNSVEKCMLCVCSLIVAMNLAKCNATEHELSRVLIFLVDSALYFIRSLCLSLVLLVDCLGRAYVLPAWRCSIRGVGKRSWCRNWRNIIVLVPDSKSVVCSVPFNRSLGLTPSTRFADDNAQIEIETALQKHLKQPNCIATEITTSNQWKSHARSGHFQRAN